MGDAFSVTVTPVTGFHLAYLSYFLYENSYPSVEMGACRRRCVVDLLNDVLPKLLYCNAHSEPQLQEAF
jgi:hypothetical protein